MERFIQCPLCDFDLNYDIVLRSNDFFLTREDFNIIKCPNCSTLLTDPYPDENETSRYYESEEYISHTDSTKTMIEKLYHIAKRRMMRKKIKLIETLLPEKQNVVLDYGCGTGDFLAECKKKNIETLGVERNSMALKKAEEKNLNIVANIDDIDKNLRGKVNVITMWHVFEHLSNPKEIFEKIIRLLSENGSVVIAVPEHESYDAGVYKKFWAAYDLPRHLLHLNEKSLNSFMSLYNFELIIKKALPFDSFYVSILSEKHKGKKPLFTTINGMIIGLISNIYALTRRKPFSSQAYVYKLKRKQIK